MKLGCPLVDETPRHEKPFWVPLMDGAMCQQPMLLACAEPSFGEKQYPLAVAGSEMGSKEREARRLIHQIRRCHGTRARGLKRCCFLGFDCRHCCHLDDEERHRIE
jgi:hypothetical protein